MEHRIIEIIIVLICVGIAFYVIERAPVIDGIFKWGIMALVAVLAIVYLL
jgi:hypothetical protein